MAPVLLVAVAASAWGVVWAARAAERLWEAHQGRVLFAAAAAVTFAVLVQLRRRRRARSVVEALRESDRDVESVDGMLPGQVEDLVARLLTYGGCSRVSGCGGAGDLGADVTGVLPDGRLVVVQVKHYVRPVGCEALQTFNGTVRAVHGADVALFVTTSRFTRAAAEFAESQRIVCVDGPALDRWMRGMSLGDVLAARPVRAS